MTAGTWILQALGDSDHHCACPVCHRARHALHQLADGLAQLDNRRIAELTRRVAWLELRDQRATEALDLAARLNPHHPQLVARINAWKRLTEGAA